MRYSKKYGCIVDGYINKKSSVTGMNNHRYSEYDDRVYSYNTLIAIKVNGIWFLDNTKFSRTTNNHQQQASRLLKNTDHNITDPCFNRFLQNSLDRIKRDMSYRKDTLLRELIRVRKIDKVLEKIKNLENDYNSVTLYFKELKKIKE